MKKSILFLSLSLVIHTFKAQNGSNSSNWKMTGNSISTGDFIGTTNNKSFDIRVNNNSVASFTTGGLFKLNAFQSSANQIVYVDANGIFQTKPLGLANQYLNGFGQWTNLPSAGSTGLWFQNGNNV